MSEEKSKKTAKIIIGVSSALLLLVGGIILFKKKDTTTGENGTGSGSGSGTGSGSGSGTGSGSGVGNVINHGIDILNWVLDIANGNNDVEPHDVEPHKVIYIAARNKFGQVIDQNQMEIRLDGNPKYKVGDKIQLMGTPYDDRYIIKDTWVDGGILKTVMVDKTTQLTANAYYTPNATVKKMVETAGFCMAQGDAPDTLRTGERWNGLYWEKVNKK